MVLLNARQDSPWTAGRKPVCTQQWAGGTQALESLGILDGGGGGVHLRKALLLHLGDPVSVFTAGVCDSARLITEGTAREV